MLNGHLDSVSSLHFRGFPLDTFIEILVIAQRYEHFKVSPSCALECSRLNPQQQKQIIFFKKDIRGTAYLPAENEIKHISLAPHKDLLKMTLKPHYTSPNSKSARRKDGGNTSRNEHRQGLSEINSNSIETNQSESLTKGVMGN